jgi:hypothetical protein
LKNQPAIVFISYGFHKATAISPLGNLTSRVTNHLGPEGFDMLRFLGLVKPTATEALGKHAVDLGLSSIVGRA